MLNLDIFDSSIDITSTYQSTVIWNHRSFCGNCLSSLYPVAVFFFLKLIVCPLKNGNLCRAFLEMSIKDWSEPKQNIKGESVAFVFPI